MCYFRCYFFIIASSLLLVGCKVGPNFHSPAVPQTQAYTITSLKPHTVSAPGPGGQVQYLIAGQDIPAQWWCLFHSQSLNNLIIRGIANSPNMDSAQAALRQAEENLRAEVGSGFLPSIDGKLGAQRQQQAGAIFGTSVIPNSIFSLYNASVDVSYSLDVFGGIRRQVEAAEAQVEYQAYEVEATYLTLTANIVTTAITEASLRKQIEATQSIIQLLQNELQIVQKQLELGAASEANVLTQETQLQQAMATLPPLYKSLALTQDSLAVLVGSLPSEAQLPDFNLDSLNLPTQLPISMPSELVRQRPDVRAAEALLHVASAQVGVATANMLPQFPLTANYGQVSNKTSTLFDSTATFWSLGGDLMQPLFHGGALSAQRRGAIDAYQQAAAEYKQTVLLAFQNVADALNALEIDAQTLRAQALAESAAYKNLIITQKQYRLGAVDYLTLLNAEQQYQETLISRVQAQAARYSDTAALFQALGGGWWSQAQHNKPSTK